jgi:hypothetical protein
VSTKLHWISFDEITIVQNIFSLLMIRSNDGMINVGVLQALQLSKVPSSMGKTSL